MASTSDQASKGKGDDARPRRGREYRGTGIWWGLVAVLLLLAAIIAYIIASIVLIPFPFAGASTDTSLRSLARRATSTFAA